MKPLYGDLQINIEMRIKFILIASIILFSLFFVSAAEETDFEKIVSGTDYFASEVKISGTGIEAVGQKGNGATFTIIKENANLAVGEDIFENILPQSQAGHPTYIEIDEHGKITKADFSTTEKGGTYIFENTKVNVPANSHLMFKNGKIEIMAKEGSEFKETPSFIDSNVKGYETKIVGENFKLPNGQSVSGTLSFKENGQAFVEAGEIVNINGVEITKEFSLIGLNIITGEMPKENEVDLFFDGKKHEGNYISLGGKNLMVSSQTKGDGPKIEFKEDNPYLKIEEGDLVQMQPIGDSQIEIKNRDSEKLIPQVVVTGDFRIVEDSKTISSSSIGKVTINSNNNFQTTTSPIDLKIIKRDSYSALLNSKILVDNFNRIAIVPEGQKEVTISLEGIEIPLNARIKYNYPSIDSISSMTSTEISFNDMDEGHKSLILGKLRDYYNSLPSEMQNSLSKIQFANDDYFENIFGKEKNVGAFARGDEVVFREDERFNLKTFRHETAHVLEYKIFINEEKIKSVINKIKDVEDQLKKETNILLDLTLPISEQRDQEQREKIKFLRDEQKELKSTFFKLSQEIESPFEKEWRQIAGDYSKISERNDEGYFEYKESFIEKVKGDGLGSGPRKGVIRPYGGSSFSEDVATFNERINNPGFFKDLINPSSEKYDQKYDQKLLLLYEYGFMSDKEYNAILREAEII